jgi:hypothetical protein
LTTCRRETVLHLLDKDLLVPMDGEQGLVPES